MAKLPVKVVAGSKLYTPEIDTSYYDYNGRCLIANIYDYIKYQPRMSERYEYIVNSKSSAGTLDNITNTFYTIGISTTIHPII